MGRLKTSAAISAGKKALFLICIFVAVVGRKGGATFTPIGSRISFQAHSYNDMRSWHQLFLKGATHIKIDPNFQSAAFCSSQERDSEHDKRGCFVLNHDTPNVLSRRFDYNTTFDLLTLLGNRASTLRKYLTRPNVRVYFALCFKNIPTNVCAQQSAEAQHWLGLVDDLVASYLNAVSRDPELNVEFVLDSGVPQDCFIQRWRPLVSTSGPPAAFVSNNKSQGFDRWQVLNGKWPPGEKGQFATYASRKWGKFVNSTYAFQVWEPCDQKDFLQASGTYISAGYDHSEGLKFAINVDPAMSKVYLAPQTVKGDINEVVIENGTLGRLVRVSENALLLTYMDESGQATMYSLKGSKTWRPLPGWKHALPPTSLSSSTQGSMVAAVAADGTVQLYKYRESTLSSAGEPAMLRDGHVAANIIDSSSSGMELVQIYEENGSLFSQIWSINSTNVSAVGASVEIAKEVTFVSGDIVATKSANGTYTVVSLFTNGSSSTLRLSVFDWHNESQETTPYVSDRFIGVGRTPSMSLRGGRIAAAFADAFCPNNEKQNKATHPGSCDLEPISIPGVMSYALGPIDAWKNIHALSHCAEDILHGAFSQGSDAPSIVLFANATSLGCLHGPYAGNDPNKCGMPSVGVQRQRSLVLDGWSFTVPQ